MVLNICAILGGAGALLEVAFPEDEREFFMTTALCAAVRRFAGVVENLSVTVLDNPAWSYGSYAGVRYALLHTTLELEQLAARLHELCRVEQRGQTLAQVTLAQHQAAFRDFEALLIGIDAEIYRKEPALREWSLATIVWHVHEVERFFYSAILNALHNPAPQALDDEQMAEVAGEALLIDQTGSVAEMWADFERLHGKVQRDLQTVNAEQLGLRSPAWEDEPWPTVEFRLHRFASHLREHANQVEKTLRWLNLPLSEAHLLLRQLYGGLAAVEGALIGASALGADLVAAQVEIIDQRAADLAAALQRIDSMAAAVRAGDLAVIEALLQAHPELAYCTLDDGLPVLLYAQYHGRQEIVAVLLASGMRLYPAEAAAVGDLARVQRILAAWPAAIDHRSSDGFTPLQLACFFGHDETGIYLIEQGADVNAVAGNPMQIQALHAAVAGRRPRLVQRLIAGGADVNARQQDNFTPLMAARQNQDMEIAQMLLDAGALE